MTAIAARSWLDRSHDIVVVSPHSDAAAFSVAGVLKLCYDSGRPITVITCFSRTCYAPRLILRTARRVTSMRKREDSAFIGLSAATDRMMWLDWDDAILRNRSHKGVFPSRPLGTRDQRLVADLTGVLRDVVDPSSTLLIPFGLGAHIDHRIAEEAGSSLIAQGFSLIMFYEDLPYAARDSMTSLDRWIADFSSSKRVRLIPDVVTFSNFIDWKKQAVQRYRSQVTGEAWNRIVQHARRLNPLGAGAERVWHLLPEPA